jgi:hypothetical protein
MSSVIEAWGELSVRETFAEAAWAFVSLVRRIPADSWDSPGLGKWDLRSLVGHTSRSLVTVETYLGRPAEVDDVPSPAAYYAAIADTDHAAVAARGVEAGQALGGDPAQFVDAVARRVLARLAMAGDPLILTAAGGMRLESYLSTRTFELVVHSLDIAAAVPRVEPPEFSDRLLSEVARVAATAAVLLGRGVELLRAMTGRATLSPGFSMV